MQGTRNNRRSLGIPILAMALVLAGCEPTGSDTDAVSLIVSLVNGQVRVLRTNSRPLPARAGMRLKQSEQVRTLDQNSYCDIRTHSGSVIRVLGNSLLQLDELFRSQERALEKTGLELMLGTLLLKIRTLTKNDRLEVATRCVVCGVRGTKFIVSHSSNTGSRVSVHQGRVWVRRRLVFKFPQVYGNVAGEFRRLVAENTSLTLTNLQSVRVTHATNLVLQQKIQRVLDKMLAQQQQEPATRAGQKALARHLFDGIKQELQAAQPRITVSTSGDERHFQALDGPKSGKGAKAQATTNSTSGRQAHSVAPKQDERRFPSSKRSGNKRQKAKKDGRY